MTGYRILRNLRQLFSYLFGTGKSPSFLARENASAVVGVKSLKSRRI